MPWNLIGPPKYAHVMIPGVSQWDPIWTKGLFRCNKVKDPKMRSSWIMQVGPKFNGKCPHKRLTEEIGRKKEYSLTSEAEIEVATSQKNASCHGGHWKRQRTDYPLTPPEGEWPPAPAFQALSFRNVREHVSVTLSHPVGGDMLQQPQETNRKKTAYQNMRLCVLFKSSTFQWLFLK